MSSGWKRATTAAKSAMARCAAGSRSPQSPYRCGQVSMVPAWGSHSAGRRTRALYCGAKLIAVLAQRRWLGACDGVQYQVTFEVNDVIVVDPTGNRRLAHRGDLLPGLAEEAGDRGLAHPARRQVLAQLGVALDLLDQQRIGMPLGAQTQHTIRLGGYE